MATTSWGGVYFRNNADQARRFDIFPLQGVAHVQHGKIVRGKFLGIEQYADLPGLSAIQLHAAYAVDGLDRPPHLFVGDFRQLPAAHWPAHQQGEDRVGLRVELGDDRRQRVTRQAVDGAGDFLANILRRAINVTFQHKRAGDVGKALERVHIDFVDSADRGNGVFERQYDAGHDLFGSRSWQSHFDVDGGRISLGKKVDGESAVGKRAQRYQKSDQHHREYGILDASFGELHRYSRLS